VDAIQFQISLLKATN